MSTSQVAAIVSCLIEQIIPEMTSDKCSFSKSGLSRPNSDSALHKIKIPRKKETKTKKRKKDRKKEKKIQVHVNRSVIHIPF